MSTIPLGPFLAMMDDGEAEDSATISADSHDELPQLINRDVRNGMEDDDDMMDFDDEDYDSYQDPNDSNNDNRATSFTNYRGDFDVPNVTLSTNIKTIMRKAKQMAKLAVLREVTSIESDGKLSKGSEL